MNEKGQESIEKNHDRRQKREDLETEKEVTRKDRSQKEVDAQARHHLQTHREAVVEIVVRETLEARLLPTPDPAVKFLHRSLQVHQQKMTQRRTVSCVNSSE